MVSLRVLARTRRRTICARALAFLPPQVPLPCRYCASRGYAPKNIGTRNSSSYLARRLATAGLQLAAVMKAPIMIIQRCTRGEVRSHAGFVLSLSFISYRTGNSSSEVLEVLTAFSCISWACAFRERGDASIFSVGPSRQRRSTRALPRRAGFTVVSGRIFSLMEKALHHHRAGFEPQRASSFRNRVGAPQSSLVYTPHLQRK